MTMFSIITESNWYGYFKTREAAERFAAGLSVSFEIIEFDDKPWTFEEIMTREG